MNFRQKLKAAIQAVEPKIIAPTIQKTGDEFFVASIASVRGVVRGLSRDLNEATQRARFLNFGRIYRS